MLDERNVRFSTYSTLTSTATTTTTTSGGTILGPGALTGKAILALGKITLRGAEHVLIRSRLGVIASRFPLRDPPSTKAVDRMYDDLLELSRLDMYPDNIRGQATQILLVQIAIRETKDMIQSLMKWPAIELQIFISGLVATFDPIRLSHPETKNEIVVKAYLQSLPTWESHTLSPLLEFFYQLAQSLGPESAPSLLQPDVLDFLLHLYITNFCNPLAETIGSAHKWSLLQDECTVFLASCCESKAGLEVIRRHPLHALWPICPGLLFPIHSAPERVSKRTSIWNSALRSLILWRLHSIFDMSVTKIDRFALHDVCSDLLELSGSQSMDSEIKARALRSLHRMFIRNNDAIQGIRDYFISCSFSHSVEIVAEIVRQLSRIIPRHTPESKMFFLQWDHTYLADYAVLHFLHLFLKLSSCDEAFRVVAFTANVLGLTRPFLEAELREHLDIHMVSHEGDNLTIYDPKDSTILRQIEEHGLEELLPNLSAHMTIKPATVYRRTVLRGAFDMFLLRGDGSWSSASSSSTDWDNLPASLGGNDHAAAWTDLGATG